jgi:pimeloyl-ACP methyl ester carboxylesterase
LNDETIGPVCFRHDPRLLLPSYQYITPEQAEAYIARISVPTLVITADKGWPVANLEEMVKGFGDKLTRVRLQGGHHCHADPDSAPAVIASVLKFLNQT